MKKKNWRKNIVVTLAIIMLMVYLIWRTFFTLPIGYGAVTLACGILMLLCEAATGLENILHLFMATNVYEPELPYIPKDWYPDVDVFIATHNEPEELLYKTVNGCVHMDYPDKSKVHIWICDDGNRESLAQLAKKMGVGYFGRANNKLAKAGNLNNALSKTSGTLIATFDADMIPTHDFLMKTVPYFFLPKVKKLKNGTWVERKEDEIDKDYKIGFIQTPQNFYNPDLFQFNLYSENKIPNEQDYFFKEVNVNRNKTNTPIYAGSNTLISREALELVGGIATGTITEDFETGIKIQNEGYKCYATSTVLAHGLTPTTIDALIKQRERWARGCIYSLRRTKLWNQRKMSFKAKLSYYSCELYWWSFFRRFVFVLAPIIFVLFNVPVIISGVWGMFIVWLPSYLMMMIATKTVSSKIRNPTWSIIIDTIMYPYLVVPICKEALGIRKTQFDVTEKKRATIEERDLSLAIPHIILSICSIFAIIVAVYQIIQYESVGPIIILFWLLVNFNALIMSVFFMLGRTNKRMTERYLASLPIILEVQEDIMARTYDISETGFSVNMDRPVLLPTDEDIPTIIYGERYKANLKAKIVHTKQIGDVWRYSFEITELDEKIKKNTSS